MLAALSRDRHADAVGQRPVVNGVGVDVRIVIGEAAEEAVDGLFGAGSQIQRGHSVGVAERLVAVIRAESRPVVVGLEVQILAVVVGEIIINIDRLDHTRVELGVRRLDVLRLGIRLVLTRFQPVRQIILGAGRNHHVIDLHAAQLACQGVDRLRIGGGAFVAAAEQLKALTVPVVVRINQLARGVVVLDDGRLEVGRREVVSARGRSCRLNLRNAVCRLLLLDGVGRNLFLRLRGGAALEHRHQEDDDQYQKPCADSEDDRAVAHAAPSLRLTPSARACVAVNRPSRRSRRASLRGRRTGTALRALRFPRAL